MHRVSEGWLDAFKQSLRKLYLFLAASSSVFELSDSLKYFLERAKICSLKWL